MQFMNRFLHRKKSTDLGAHSFYAKFSGDCIRTVTILSLRETLKLQNLVDQFPVLR